MLRMSKQLPPYIKALLLRFIFSQLVYNNTVYYSKEWFRVSVFFRNITKLTKKQELSSSLYIIY